MFSPFVYRLSSPLFRSLNPPPISFSLSHSLLSFNLCYPPSLVPLYSFGFVWCLYLSLPLCPYSVRETAPTKFYFNFALFLCVPSLIDTVKCENPRQTTLDKLLRGFMIIPHRSLSSMQWLMSSEVRSGAKMSHFIG